MLNDKLQATNDKLLKKKFCTLHCLKKYPKFVVRRSSFLSTIHYSLNSPLPIKTEE